MATWMAGFVVLFDRIIRTRSRGFACSGDEPLQQHGFSPRTIPLADRDLLEIIRGEAHQRIGMR